MIESAVVATVLSVSALLFLASVIYVANRWVRAPFAVTLVLVGLGLGELIRQFPSLAPLGSLQLSADVLTFIFMPTLVFQAAFATDTRLLLKNVLPVTVLAVPAVLISSVAAGFGLHWAVGVPLGAALLFGAIVSSTDSAAVLTLFRELGAPKRLTLLVDGENLLNDAASIVAFRVVLSVLGIAGGLTLVGDGVAGSAIVSFFYNFLGGLVVGSTLGYLFGKLIEYIEDNDLIEILLTTVMAYLTFIFAEVVVGVSGVMAVVGAGLVLSGWGRTKYSPPTLQYLERFWSYLAFMASSLVFLMVGLATHVAELTGVLGPIGWAVLVAIAARALSIFGLFPVVNRLPGIERTGLRYQSVLVWGGIRGAITLVLAMSLPMDFPYRELFLQLAFGVVLFSLIVQGLTLEPLMRALRLDRATLPELYVRDGSLLSAKHKARERLAELRSGGMFDTSVVSQLEQNYAAEEQRIRTQIEELRGAGQLGGREEMRLLKREYLLVEKRAYLDLFNRGQLSEKGLKDLQHSIELQIDFIRSGGLLPAWTIHSPIRWKVEAGLFRLLDALLPYSRLVQQWRLNRIADRYEEHWGRLVATGQVLKELDRLEARRTISTELLDEMRVLYARWHENARSRLDAIGTQFPEYASKVQQLMAARLGLQAEAEVISDYEQLELLSEREARSLREEVSRKLRRLRQKPLEELAPRPRELLAKVPFFRGLPADEFDRIAELLRTRTFLADEVVLREGDVGNSLFLIGRGVVRVSIGGEGVPAVSIATLVAGDFFGEIAIITGNPRNASVTAVTHCTLYELRREDLEAVQILCPTVQQFLEAAAEERNTERGQARAEARGSGGIAGHP